MAKCNFLEAKVGRWHEQCNNCWTFMCNPLFTRSYRNAHTLLQPYAHRAMTDGLIFHLVMRFHYGPASSCCLATVISPVAVTAAVAICSPVAQLLCPVLIALCFHSSARTPHGRLLVPFASRSWQSPEYPVDDVIVNNCLHVLGSRDMVGS